MTTAARITLITGATRGIGLACAQRLAASGHAVIGMARHAPQGGFPGEFVAVDFTDREASAHALAAVTRTHAVTGLVNNVGIVRPQLLAEVALADFDAVMQVNLVCALQCAQACLPAMRAQRFGRIVNIASEFALGAVTRSAYATSKAGLISLARTWALELAADGITVNAVAPGAVDTEFFRDNNPPGSEQRTRKQARIPVGRLGTPADIANAVEFFMRVDSAWVTGQTLHVDGGSSLGASDLL